MMKVFNETQKFDQWWMHVINITIIGFLLYAVYTWFLAKPTMGQDSTANNIGLIIAVTAALPAILILYSMQLKTTIDDIGVHYHFFPMNLSKKAIRWSELKNCYVRTYKPLAEFGGWGYQKSFGKGKAVTVKGNKGIQLEFKTGVKLLIGTQKEEEARQLVERYFKLKDE